MPSRYDVRIATLLLFAVGWALGAGGQSPDDARRAGNHGAPTETASTPHDDVSNLTLDRLFTLHEFDTDPVPEIRWSRTSTAYYTLDAAEAGPGFDLVRNDLADGRREVVVPATALIPHGARDPLDIESYELSQDETKVLIYTNSRKVWRRNTRGDYWVLDVNSRVLRRLGGDAKPASLMFAKFSPDGSQVAFVRDNNLYVQDLADMSITALTRDGSTTRINGTSDWVNEEELDLRDCFRWSPDGKRILFWQFDTSGVGTFHLIDNTTDLYPRLTSFPYPKVGERNSSTRLGVVAVQGGDITWLDLPGDPREHYLPHAEWTPDGTRILVQQMNRLQSENRVLLADPQTGAAEHVFTESDAAWLENENPVRWINHGEGLLWVSEQSGWRHAYVAPLDGSRRIPLTQGEFDLIDVVHVHPHGKELYFTASPENATQKYLYRVAANSGSAERLTPDSQPGWHEYEVAPDGRWAIHTYSTFSTPPVVELVRLPDHVRVRLFTDNSRLREKIAALRRPRIEFLKIDIGDGIVLDGWSLTPPDGDAEQKYPLLMHVYGEPHGQTVRDAWRGPRGLWHWMMAQRGYVVASVDNRGTNIPRGRAWRKCIHRQIGILAPREQAEALRVLLERWSFVDPARVGIWGWSGGGSMSLNAIFRYPDLYRTAVAVAPNADQRLYDTIYQERYMGLPSDNADGYREGSPITHAHRLRGNLLVIHGTGDDNGHYQGTERLMNELIKWRKQFTVLPYPSRSHSLSEGENTVVHFWEYITRYLDDHLRSPCAPEPEPVYEARNVRGWTLYVQRELWVSEPARTARAVELLGRQLEEVTRVVPEKAVRELQKVPLYFHDEYPGKRPTAEFHPDAEWLRANGRDPAMARGIEFTNIRHFEQEMNRMPNFALHELAHAYHFRVLPQGFRNPEIRAAYEHAKEAGLYDRVERRYGNGRPNTRERAYAMTNPMEYFAECTEAYFATNDFFPFTHEELQRHDPTMFELLGRLWGVDAKEERP